MTDVAAAASGRPFSPRSVALMLLVGVGAFVVLVALAAYAPELRGGGDGGGHALSRSAVGFAGLARLLEDTGTPVVVSRGPTPVPEGAPGLMILTPGPDATAEEVVRLRARRPVLIVLPKWNTVRDPRRDGWASRLGLWPTDDLIQPRKPGALTELRRRSGVSRPVLKGRGGPFSADRDYPLGPIEALQTGGRADARILLADEAGRPILLQLDQTTYLLTDPDLLDNQGLKSLDTARTALLMLETLRGGQGPVVFDVSLNGLGRSRSLLRLALGPPFLGATLCALAAAALMGLHAAARFGAPLRPERAFALGKRALVDNAAALIRLARREPRMGGRYAALVRRAAAHAAGVGGVGGAERVDAVLDRLTPEGEAPFSTLLAATAEARDDAELMQAVRRLHQRRLEMTRERT